ncbi:transposase [Kitasatospora sp. McL0602]|uniref:transposase n=1 Tax=Kitasatospora sp. McL0602 TaxID=3439530 RepID=UPI003F8B4B3B
MSNKQGKRYSDEFKRDAVTLVRSSSKTVTEVARDLGVSPEGLRSWVKKDQADRGEGSSGELTSAEREELRGLRRRNLEQQKTIEVLKKATVNSTGQRNTRGRRGCGVWQGWVVPGCRTRRSVSCGTGGRLASRSA